MGIRGSKVSWSVILGNLSNFLKYTLLIMLLQLSHFFSPLYYLPPCTPHPPAFPHLTSCPWVIRISSLASPFPVLFLTSPVDLYLPFMLLIPCTFSPILSPPPLPTHNPPCDLHFCDSVPVLVVCLVCFCFVFLGSVVDSCEFVVILLFIFLIFFFLDKSL